jgi:hypothetical protein
MRSNIRLEKLKRLCEEAGGHTEVARRARVSPDNLWQILHGTPLPSGNPRGVGNQLAQKLERAFGKAAGWMDVASEDIPSTLAPSTLTQPDQVSKLNLADILQYSTQDERRRVLDAIRLQLLHARERFTGGRFENYLDALDDIDKSSQQQDRRPDH